jgi:hypothetical protein
MKKFLIGEKVLVKDVHVISLDWCSKEQARIEPNLIGTIIATDRGRRLIRYDKLGRSEWRRVKEIHNAPAAVNVLFGDTCVSTE